jgi:hypothetical protein
MRTSDPFRNRVSEIEGETKITPTAEETTKIKVCATFKYPPQLAESYYAQDLQVQILEMVTRLASLV